MICRKIGLRSIVSRDMSTVPKGMSRTFGTGLVYLSQIKADGAEARPEAFLAGS